MTLIRRVISSLRHQPPDLGRFFRPSAIPLVRIPPRIAIWNEEPLEKYCSGGYHPVRLGDTFNNRYSIIRKLGYGSYATVWLARDMNLRRHVALKILTADAYGDETKNIFELDILKRVKDADPSHPGYNHVLHLLDNFIHTGPHGNHVCMVFEPMGHDMFLFSRRCVGRKMPIYIVKELARQLLAALDYLHCSCGVIHTDIKPRNILVSINHIVEQVIHDFLWETQPKVEPREPSQLEYLINSNHLMPDMPDWIAELNFKLVDFGVASWTDNHLSEWIQPQSFRAPEVILGAKWDASTDIWNTACVLYELAAGKILFDGKFSDEDSYEEMSHLGQMFQLLGTFPYDLLLEGEYTDEYFDTNGDLFNAQELRRYSLKQMIQDARPDIVEDKAVAFEAFLLAMLRYRPKDRLTPKELIHHPWLETYD